MDSSLGMVMDTNAKDNIDESGLVLQGQDEDGADESLQ